MKTILETKRLLLEKFDEEDHVFIVRLVNSEGWLKYIGDRKVRTKDEAIAYLRNGPMKSYEVNGFGLCKVSLKETGEPIGMCGLIKRETLEDIDIGFAFLPEYAGAGYGFEIAQATLNYGFNDLSMQRIVGITIPTNERSIKLLEKIGMRLEKSYNSNGEELLLYGMSKVVSG